MGCEDMPNRIVAVPAMSNKVHYTNVPRALVSAATCVVSVCCMSRIGKCKIKEIAQMQRVGASMVYQHEYMTVHVKIGSMAHLAFSAKNLQQRCPANRCSSIYCTSDFL